MRAASHEMAVKALRDGFPLVRLVILRSNSNYQNEGKVSPVVFNLKSRVNKPYPYARRIRDVKGRECQDSLLAFTV